MFQELLLKSDYFGAKSDEKIYVDLRGSLEYTDEIAKQSRNYSKLNITIELRVWGYTNGEYLYMMTDRSLTFKYKTYTIMSLDDAFEA